MDIEIDISGEVAERQELLNGTETVSLEGRSADGRWEFSGLVTWNIGLVSNTGEGDITLTRDDGAELYGTLVRGDVVETTSADAESEVDHEMQLEYEIDGGTGALESAAGACSATGRLSASTFTGRWLVSLEP